MKFKNNALGISFILMIAISAQAKEGGMQGGGGLAHVCKDAAGNITRAEMYDLFEGRKRYDMNDTVDSTLSVDDLIKNAVQKVALTSPGISVRLQAALEVTRSTFRVGATPLNLVGDAQIRYREEGCDDVQIAYWDERAGKVSVNEEIWSHFDSKSKAALYIHEASYFLDRLINNNTTSDNAREFTASAFYENKARISVLFKTGETLMSAFGVNKLDDVTVTNGTTGAQMSVGNAVVNWQSPQCYVKKYSERYKTSAYAFWKAWDQTRGYYTYRSSTDEVVKLDLESDDADHLKITNPYCNESYRVSFKDLFGKRVGTTIIVE